MQISLSLDFVVWYISVFYASWLYSCRIRFYKIEECSKHIDEKYSRYFRRNHFILDHGYGLMYGASNGYVATSDIFFNPGDGAHDVFFQTVFCATAATIVSGAIAGRTKYTTYDFLCNFFNMHLYTRYPVDGSGTVTDG